MKIITWSRNALGHDVVYLNAENKLTRRQFPASLTDEEVRAEVLNLPKPEKKVDAVPPAAKTKEPAKTIPEPPATPKSRVSRQNMIDALEAAGVTNYEPNNFGKLKAAYEALKKGGK